MRQELMELLRRTSRRMTAVRAAEASAVALTAGAIGSAVVELAWMLRPMTPAWAVLLCQAATAAGLVCISGRIRRALSLDRSQATAVGGVFILAGLGGLVFILAGGGAAWLIPAVLLPVSVITGCTSAVLARPKLKQTALELDLRFALRERLSTAVELDAAGADANGRANCVYAQAVQAARSANLATRPLWRRTRRTAGAMGLALLLAGAMLLPQVPQRQTPPVVAGTPASMPAITLSQQMRAQLLDRLRTLARSAGTQEVAVRATQAQAAIADNDPARLERALADLAAAGVDLQPILLAVRLPATGSVPSPGRAISGDQPTGPTSRVAPTATPEAPAYVRVMNPYYTSTGTASTMSSADIVPPVLPWADAWTRARSDAADALTSGRVAAEHRRLVQRFFALGESSAGR